MKVEYINCQNCGKTIKKQGTRVLCIACTNIKDKIRIAERNQSPEYKAYQKMRRERKKGE